MTEVVQRPFLSRILRKRIRGREMAVASAYFLLVAAGLAWTSSMGSVATLCSLAVCAVSLFSSSETCCRLLFICFPFFNIMGVDLGGTSMFYVLIGLFTVKSFMDGSVESMPKRLALYGVIMLLTCYNFTAGLTYVKWLVHLLVPVFLVGTGRLRVHFSDYIRYLTISLVISSIIGQAMMDSGVYLYTFGSVRTGSEVTTRFSGLVGDAVVYGQLVSVVVAANVYLASVKRGYRLLVPLCLTLVFFSFLTYSKGALVSLAIVGLFALVVFMRRALREKLPAKYVFFIFAAVVVSYFGASFMLSGSSAFSPEALLTRLGSDDLLTARRQIWEAYFDLWEQTGVPIVFKGVGFDTYIGTTVYGRWHNAHNIYIEAVTLFGLLGFLTMAVALVAYLMSCIKKGLSSTAYLPCIVLLATGFILHGFLDFPFFYLWTVALGCLDCDCHDKNSGRLPSFSTRMLKER